MGRLSSLKIDPLQGLLCSRARRKPGPLSFIFHLYKERQKKLCLRSREGRHGVGWDERMRLGGQVLPGVVVLILAMKRESQQLCGTRSSLLGPYWVSSGLQLCLKVTALCIFREPHSSRLPCGCRQTSARDGAAQLLTVFCQFFIF